MTSAKNSQSIVYLMKEILQVVLEKKELVSLDESKLMSYFGVYGLTEF